MALHIALLNQKAHYKSKINSALRRVPWYCLLFVPTRILVILLVSVKVFLLPSQSTYLVVGSIEHANPNLVLLIDNLN